MCGCSWGRRIRYWRENTVRGLLTQALVLSHNADVRGQKTMMGKDAGLRLMREVMRRYKLVLLRNVLQQWLANRKNSKLRDVEKSLANSSVQMKEYLQSRSVEDRRRVIDRAVRMLQTVLNYARVLAARRAVARWTTSVLGDRRLKNHVYTQNQTWAFEILLKHFNALETNGKRKAALPFAPCAPASPKDLSGPWASARP